MSNADYERLRRVIRGEDFPVAIVDLNAIDANVEALVFGVRERKKKLRVASKSIRCLDLLTHVMQAGGDVMHGVMSYSVREAAHLVAHGIRDVFVAYPSAHPHDAELLADLNADDATVSIAVDDVEHLAPLASAGARVGSTVPVVIDVDMSLRFLEDHLHVGVRRSPLSTAEQVLALARRIVDTPHLSLHGIMGYEAQIAGVTDDSPFSRAMNAPIRSMKRISRRHVAKVRREIADALADAAIPYEIFNGGGSGSLHWTTEEDAITEVTAGSGFLGSHLFDYYRALDVAPGIFFAVQIVRRPAPDLVTCHGGGLVASGEPGPDRLPLPYLPPGLALTKLEGAGEVQTPLSVPSGTTLGLGDPVFFRHAKAGELAEHFNEYLFVRGEKIEHRAKTYRGEGHTFL